MTNLVNRKLSIVEGPQLPKPFQGIISNPVMFTDSNLALDYICSMYASNVEKLQKTDCLVTYPYIGIYLEKDKGGLINGAYGTTISHPDILFDYYKEQFRFLIDEHSIPIWIGLSDYPMSLIFVDEDLFNTMAMQRTILPSSMPCMQRIQRGLNGLHESKKIRPLSVFHGERTGYSLNRLHHYCGTDAQYFQNSVIFANYHIYVEFFIEYAQKKIDEGLYDEFIGPGIRISRNEGLVKSETFFKPQMPAYHLIKSGRGGITLVNVNVGPSNIKTITDHIAVLRSHQWIMLGHCAGLRHDNKIGDYVVAHNYLRYDYVLDSYVPKHVPVTSSPQLSQLFLSTAEKYMENSNNKIHTGTVVTTCDRNWELNQSMVEEFSAAKAIGIDMESATVATNAFRFGVDSVAFLCISDMPLHGAPKLRSMAKEFYRTKVHDHFNICMEALIKSNQTTLRFPMNDDSLQYSYCGSASTPFR